MACRKNSPGRPCPCYVCRNSACEVGADVPVGSKEILFDSSGCNPLSQSATAATFTLNESTCCSTSTVPMTANYLSPLYSGSSIFLDGGDAPVYFCCTPTSTEYLLRTIAYDSQLLFAFGYKFRLRLCNLQIIVCQKLSGVCGIDVKVRAVYGFHLDGFAVQYCQTRARTINYAISYTCNGISTNLSASDTTTWFNNCCNTGTSTSGPSVFATVPELSVADPSAFECAYSASSFGGPGGIYSSSDGNDYFHVERTLFLPGATSVPSTALTFTAAGQAVSGMFYAGLPPPIVSSQPTYGAGTSTYLDTNACGRARYSYNYMNGLFVNTGCGGNPINDRRRSETHYRSLSPGSCFYDATNDPWQIVIRDP